MNQFRHVVVVNNLPAFLAIMVLPAAIAVVFPEHVYRFYASRFGESFTSRHEPRHLRNGAIVWLVWVAVMTIMGWW